MVRFKTRWLLLAIDDRPLATSSPFHAALDHAADSAQASSSALILSSARKTRETGTAATLTPQLITRLLRASLVTNFGDVAAGAFGGSLTCKYYSTHTGTAIVRCSRDAARLIWASATFISSPVEMSVHDPASVEEQFASLRIRVIHCGGTIKKAQNKAIELDRKLILRLRAKQEELATSPNHVPSSDSKSLNLATIEQNPPVTSTFSVAPVNNDEEDLGEALDPDTPMVNHNEPVAVPTAASHTTQHHKIVPIASKLDPETQTLLAQSRKQINSISM